MLKETAWLVEISSSEQLFMSNCPAEKVFLPQAMHYFLGPDNFLDVILL